MVDHDPPVGENAVPVKGRLREPPLPQPEVTLAIEQAIAEKVPRHLQAEMLDEISALGQQDFLDGDRVADEQNRSEADAQRDEVAVFASALGEEFERRGAE